jgi:hypothetical protein
LYSLRKSDNVPDMTTTDKARWFDCAEVLSVGAWPGELLGYTLVKRQRIAPPDPLAVPRRTLPENDPLAQINPVRSTRSSAWADLETAR